MTQKKGRLVHSQQGYPIDPDRGQSRMTMLNYNVVNPKPISICSQSKGGNDEAKEASGGGTELDISSSIVSLL